MKNSAQGLSFSLRNLTWATHELKKKIKMINSRQSHSFSERNLSWDLFRDKGEIK
ncbi:MAG: hypothetical protein R3331_02775 [Sulfurospirillaceae bacterium]|nr:hypothetical protein [Sulfurospirillaceae bacterium]